MVSAYTRFNGTTQYTEFKGLANDPRPLNAKPGDVFMETDTLDNYQFNGYFWELVPLYGSGGGSNGDIPSVAIKVSKPSAGGDITPVLIYGDRSKVVTALKSCTPVKLDIYCNIGNPENAGDKIAMALAGRFMYTETYDYLYISVKDPTAYLSVDGFTLDWGEDGITVNNGGGQ